MIGACVLIGPTNAFVSVLRVSSFIATLGTGAIMAAITSALSGDETITGRVGSGYTKLATTNWRHPDPGAVHDGHHDRARLLARAHRERPPDLCDGLRRETARLTGVPVRPTDRRFVCGVGRVSGFAGMVLAAQVSAGSPDVGSSYLIPAFSARSSEPRSCVGRFNPWGTVIGVLLIGTGNVALLISGGPTWTPNLFEGGILIAAVSLTSLNHEALLGRLRGWRGNPLRERRTPRTLSGDIAAPQAGGHRGRGELEVRAAAKLPNQLFQQQ